MLQRVKSAARARFNCPTRLHVFSVPSKRPFYGQKIKIFYVSRVCTIYTQPPPFLRAYTLYQATRSIHKNLLPLARRQLNRSARARVPSLSLLSSRKINPQRKTVSPYPKTPACPSYRHKTSSFWPRCPLKNGENSRESAGEVDLRYTYSNNYTTESKASERALTLYVSDKSASATRKMAYGDPG